MLIVFYLVHRTQKDAKLKKKLQTNKKHNNMKKLSLVTVLIFFLAVFANAQNSHSIKVGIPSYSLVGLSSTSTITLEPAAPTTAGDGLDFSASSTSNSDIWLNYSSIMNDNSQSNIVSVSMTGESLPAGVTIELVAAAHAGNGKGHLGSVSSDPIVLGADAQEVVTDIKNCYTGTGNSNGHQLTYTLKMNETSENYSSLTSGEFDVIITYTITDN